jgi:hypothetical protein
MGSDLKSALGFRFFRRVRAFRSIDGLDVEARSPAKSPKRGILHGRQAFISVACSIESISLIVTIALMNFYI